MIMKQSLLLALLLACISAVIGGQYQTRVGHLVRAEQQHQHKRRLNGHVSGGSEDGTPAPKAPDGEGKGGKGGSSSKKSSHVSSSSSKKSGSSSKKSGSKKGGQPGPTPSGSYDGRPRPPANTPSTYFTLF
jgi:hypothetical protein